MVSFFSTTKMKLPREIVNIICVYVWGAEHHDRWKFVMMELMLVANTKHLHRALFDFSRPGIWRD